MSTFISVVAALFSILFVNPGFAKSEPLTPKEIPLNDESPKKMRRISSSRGNFTPFTGKVVGEKVRMRLQPDLDGFIVRELNRNELLTILDQEGDYYCVECPESMKAYIFRSFVLDNVVEGNRVNIRLEPDLEAPVIGHLNSGDRVDGSPSQKNKKWLEISPPSNTHFYVAKEYIEQVGGPEYKEKMVRRKDHVQQLLEGATQLAKTEMKKPFEKINFEQIKQGFLTIIQDYSDFPKVTELAKETFGKTQEEYLQKRIHYLEQRANAASNPKESLPSTPSSQTPRLAHQVIQKWEPIEEAIYTNWAAVNDHKDKGSFYEEQKLIASQISGVLESYKSPKHKRPGDYVLKSKNIPIAYVYSTKINLDQYVGRKVTLIVSPRPNNNFAFPAYFVHEVE